MNLERLFFQEFKSSWIERNTYDSVIDRLVLNIVNTKGRYSCIYCHWSTWDDKKSCWKCKEIKVKWT